MAQECTLLGAVFSLRVQPVLHYMVSLTFFHAKFFAAFQGADVFMEVMYVAKHRKKGTVCKHTDTHAADAEAEFTALLILDSFQALIASDQGVMLLYL